MKERGRERERAREKERERDRMRKRKRRTGESNGNDQQSADCCPPLNKLRPPCPPRSKVLDVNATKERQGNHFRSATPPGQKSE